MGQKVSPIGLRLGINKTWSSRWFEDNRSYADSLHEDLSIRRYITNYYYKTLKEEHKKIGGKKDAFDPAISNVEIVRFPDRINVFIATARAGIVIGPKGQRVEIVKNVIQKMVKKPVQVSIKEIKDAELDATLSAQNVARQLEMRVAFRRAMKGVITQAMKKGAKGIKVMCSGRLAGADIARTEQYKNGSVPLHTLRANIDYGTAEASTTFGIIGVKVWIYKGEILDKREQKQDDAGEVISSKGDR